MHMVEKEKQRIIFLDIDGVLDNAFSYPAGSSRILNASFHNLQVLSYLVKQTMAKIVICSSWVTNKEIFQKVQNELMLIANVKCEDFCTNLDGRKDIAIIGWCKEHDILTPEEFVIVDDEPVGRYYSKTLNMVVESEYCKDIIRSRSVRVNSMDGLCFRDCLKVFELFEITDIQSKISTDTAKDWSDF